MKSIKGFKSDNEGKQAMIKELAIIKGLISDDDNEVGDLNDYFKKLGV